MSGRAKIFTVSLASLMVGIAAILIVMNSSLQGYGLLPFVVVAAVSLFVAFMTFLEGLFPRADATRFSVWSLVLEAVIGRLFR